MSHPFDPDLPADGADDLRGLDLAAWTAPPAPAPDVAQIIALAAGVGAVEAPAPSPSHRRPWRYAVAGGLVAAAAAALVWLVVEARREAPTATSALVAPGSASEPRVGGVAPTPTPPVVEPQAPTALPAVPGELDVPPLPTTRCDYEDLLASTKAAFAEGRWAETLRAAERAIDCQDGPREPKKLALLAACKAGNQAAFDRYYPSAGALISPARLAASCPTLVPTSVAPAAAAPVATAAPGRCDYEALLNQTKDAFGKGEYRKALSAAEQAVACNRSAAAPKKFALLAACKLQDRRAFDRYYQAAKNMVSIASLAADCLDFLPSD
jgi:type IV secretory pathway VirB10-like protein